MLLPLSCLSFVVVAFAFCVWFLVKDRNFWRNEYRARNQKAEEREAHLFDQMLRLKGFRATSEPNAPAPHVRKASLDPEELAIIEDRISERVEAGIMKPSEGFAWANQLRNGSVTPAQIDQILWQKRDHPGSVADID